MCPSIVEYSRFSTRQARENPRQQWEGLERLLPSNSSAYSESPALLPSTAEGARSDANTIFYYDIESASQQAVQHDESKASKNAIEMMK